jgi:hypothetical protein
LGRRVGATPSGLQLGPPHRGGHMAELAADHLWLGAARPHVFAPPRPSKPCWQADSGTGEKRPREGLGIVQPRASRPSRVRGLKFGRSGESKRPSETSKLRGL